MNLYVLGRMEVKPIKEEVSEVTTCSKENATSVPRQRPIKGTTNSSSYIKIMDYQNRVSAS